LAIRVGIELSPVACRIVAVDVPHQRRDDGDTRVTFATMVRADGSMSAAVASLNGQRASVVVWTADADHRQVVVTDGSYEHMRAQALAAVRHAGRSAVSTLTDIAPVSGSGGRNRRTVLLASAASAEVAALLQPLVDAGVVIDRVLTPAAALLSLARSHRSEATTGALEAYVAIDEISGCIALVRDSTLLGALDLAWGYVEELDGRRATRSRDDVATRLANDVFVFLEDCGLDPENLRHVCVTGGVPEIRSMAMSLMEQLDVEVEALDSLFGIDAAQLPGDAETFRDRAPALRLAWAAAADPHPPIDLLRMRRRRAWGVRLSCAVVAAGTAAGLVVGWEIQDRWRPAMAYASSGATASRWPSTVLAPSPGAVLLTPPARAVRIEVGADQVSAPPLAPPPETALAAPDSVPPAVSRPIFRSLREPLPVPSAVVAEVARPSVLPRRRKPPVEVRRLVPETPRPREETALPFEAALESILYGSDRRLAMVDGRIVETGDVVRGATVVEITTTAVMLRDDRGQLRRLAAGGRSR
jgi:hypothetical protein